LYKIIIILQEHCYFPILNFYSFIQSLIKKTTNVWCAESAAYFLISHFNFFLFSYNYILVFTASIHGGVMWESLSNYQLAKSSFRIFCQDRRHLFWFVRINLVFTYRLYGRDFILYSAAVKHTFSTIMFDCMYYHIV